MPDIRDIYDSSDGAEARNQWQRTLYHDLRCRLGLTGTEGLVGDFRLFSNSLHQPPPLKASQALAFLAVYGSIVSELDTVTWLSDDELYRRFGRASVPVIQDRYQAVLSWASNRPAHDVWAWRLYRVVKQLTGAPGELDDANLELLWPGVAQGETDLLPHRFPQDPASVIARVLAPDPPSPQTGGQPPGPGTNGNPPGSTPPGSTPPGSTPPGSTDGDGEQDPPPDLEFPEFFVDPAGAVTTEERERILIDNARRERFYRAVRFLLRRDFGMSDSVPAQPRDFAASFASVLDDGTLAPPDALRMIGVSGAVLAAGVQDPLLDRPREARWPDDIVAWDGKYPLRIARRFADTVVAAMQEFTSRADLYQHTQRLLAKEGQSTNGTSPVL